MALNGLAKRPNEASQSLSHPSFDFHFPHPPLMTTKSRGEITSKPADGWLHPDTALARGNGVFYSYPVHVRVHARTAGRADVDEADLARSSE